MLGRLICLLLGHKAKMFLSGREPSHESVEIWSNAIAEMTVERVEPGGNFYHHIKFHVCDICGQVYLVYRKGGDLKKMNLWRNFGTTGGQGKEGIEDESF